VRHESSIISAISNGGFPRVSVIKQQVPIGVIVKFLPLKIGEGLAKSKTCPLNQPHETYIRNNFPDLPLHMSEFGFEDKKHCKLSGVVP